MKALKSFVICLILSVLVCAGVFAASDKDNALSFGNVRYIQNGGSVTVEADVKNNTTVGKNVMLIVASYDRNGMSKNIKIKTGTVGAGENGLLQTDYSPVSGCEVKAFVLENLFDNSAMPMPAKKGADSAELAYISVNGEPIKGFSNDKTNYLVKNTDNLEIEAVAKDNTASVVIVKDENLNSYGITVTSPGGRIKKFTVTAYDKAEDTTAISKIIYKADNETEEHTVDFTDVIELPDNAKTVRVRAVADYAESVSYYVVNNAVSSPTDDVSYGTMGSQSRAAFTYERPMADNTLPIKNEESRAVIRVTGVSDTEKEITKEYIVTFKARQPRLTSFVAENRTYYPVFVSGAAIFEDNGSTCASDRNYIIKGVSPKIVGASSFLFPVNNKENNTWWHDNSSGAYFTFTADTPGTVYVISQSRINNAEYTDDTNNKKWKKSDVSAYKFEYSDNSTRVKDPDSILILPESGERDPDQSYASSMENSYYKKFRAGETVEIYHTGNNTGVNDPKVFAAVVWNSKEETIASLEGVSSKLEKDVPLLEQIPSEITATTTEDEKLLAEVEWDLATYDKEKIGWQAVEGRINVPDGYVLKSGISDKVTADVVVLQDSDYLSSLSYKVGDNEFEVENFDPKTFTYTVELPDYTNTVEVCGKSTGTVETYVENNRVAFSEGGVSYGKMTSAAQNAFTRQRPAKDNIIPVKNEESTAVIKVKHTLDGKDYEITYHVVFKARQIRLTSFSTVEAKEILKPVFVSGAAVFNDGVYDGDNGIAAAGSVVSSDREQIMTDMSDSLKGASSFLFPASNKEPGVESDPETNNWWHKHSEGAYFTFSAEQAGTVYIFAQNGFKNAEYTSDSHNEGWSPTEGLSLILKNVGATWTKGYFRSFRKGEQVKIYHTGISGTSSANDYKITGMVVWSEPVVTAIDNSAEIDIDVTKDAAEQMPKTAKITMKSGDIIDADVSWDLSGFDNSVGTHTVKGKITDEYIEANSLIFADGVLNEVTLTVNVSANKIKLINTVNPVVILQGDKITEKLPQTVTATTIFNEQVTCGVNWDTDGLDENTLGVREIEGTLTPPDGIDANGLVPKVKATFRYSDKNIVLALESSGMDKIANKWVDLSKYAKDVTIPKNSENIYWTDNGLYTAAGVDELLQIPLSDELKDAFKSHNYVIEMEFYSVSYQAGGETPFITADIEYKKDETTTSQGKLIINYNDNKKRNDFKYGSNLTKYWAVNDISDILSPKKIIIRVGDSGVYRIIGDTSEEKTLNKLNISDINSLTLTGNSKIANSNSIGGSVVWKSLKIYKVTE